MKKGAFLLILVLMSITAWAQEADPRGRDVVLRILDQKERPMNKIAVSVQNSTQKGVTDRAGQFVFHNLSDSDFISVKLTRVGESVIPIAGLDSIVLIRRSANQYAYSDNENQNLLIERMKTQPNSIMDVPAMLRDRPCNSVLELLQGQVAGLTYSGAGGSVNIRGASSRLASSEPLVLVDGAPAGPLNSVNNFLNVHDIQTIEVQKTGTNYGTRGANGVILITTKTAFAQ